MVAEALANAAKHAQASRLTVGARKAREHLQIEVHDDGIGGADLSKGSGLIGLKDRVESLGGAIRLVVRAKAGHPFTSRSRWTLKTRRGRAAMCGGMSPVDLEGLLNTDGCCSEAGRVSGSPTIGRNTGLGRNAIRLSCKYVPLQRF